MIGQDTFGPGPVVYYDPVGEPSIPAMAYRPRLRVASEARIGLVSNLFTDATPFLEDLRAPLGALLPGARFTTHDKGHRRNSTFPMAEPQLAEVAAASDAVITAFGHCGSCTAGTIRDSVAFARAGLPVVALVTAKFQDEARFIARSGGIPDVPLVILPHPVAGRDPAFQHALAAAIAPLVARALVEGASQDATALPGLAMPGLAA